MLMHVVCRFFSGGKSTNPRFIRGFLARAGIYRSPGCGTLWYMGCVGLPTILFWNHEGVLGKIAAGFNFLAWAPFLIPIYAAEEGESYFNVRLNRFLLVAYSGAFAVLGLALNARGIMFEGVATVGLLYLLRAMRSDALVTSRAVKRIGLLAL